MNDTLNLKLERDSVPGIDFLAHIPDRLPDYKTEVSKEGEIIRVNGMLGNLRIIAYSDKVYIRGSLAKYYLGDNIQTLTRKDTEMALKQLCEDLQLPIMNATVTRLDFAQNFIMDYPPEAYYPYLGENKPFERWKKGHSLYYEKYNMVLILYDKIKWCKAKRVPIPEEFQNENILRYEIRFMNRLPKHFGVKQLLAKDIIQEPFYLDLFRRWEGQYQNIPRNRIIKEWRPTQMESPKDFIPQLALMKIKEMGQDEVLKLVDMMKAQKVFDRPEYYSRLRREIKNLCQKPGMTKLPDLIAELDRKIKRAGKFAR